MAEKERDSKTEQMEKLQKDFDAKEAELANLQLKAEDIILVLPERSI